MGPSGLILHRAHPEEVWRAQATGSAESLERQAPVTPLPSTREGAFLASCAIPYSARQLADSDGAVSDAEYKHYVKQRNIKDQAMYSESVKRRNIPNVVRDANQTVRGARWLWRGLGL